MDSSNMLGLGLKSPRGVKGLIICHWFQVLDVSGAEHLQKLLPNCKRMDIIPRCGHVVDLDRPGAMAKVIKLFRKDTGAHCWC